ncbi:MAG: PQQ-dependent sugar dehydrogenase [Halothece sp.]
MKYIQKYFLVALSLIGLVSCTSQSSETPTPSTTQTPNIANTNNITGERIEFSDRTCVYVEEGFGSPGTVEVRAEEVVSGLDVPWGILFLSADEMLVTERSGDIRLVRNGQLQPSPVATIDIVDQGEGGLLDIEAHPDFNRNRLFYIYVTTRNNGQLTNRVERWQLSESGESAERDRIILDNIPVAQFHNGGRLRFGPDQMLYIGTGDARNPDLSQDVNSLAGKILRVTPEGEVPADNPFPNNPVFLTGIRNTQGFDWYDQSTLWVTDHGPSGELGRRGHDKVSVVNPGDNLGWPALHGCEDQAGMIPPSITWRNALPPGGAAVYTGNSIPEWNGSLMIGVLGGRHLHRITFDPNNPTRVDSHEVYLQGNPPDGLGRVREVIMGPDNELYVTTSNCDGRGTCPPDGDKIFRITR